MDRLRDASIAFLEHCKYAKSLSLHTLHAYDQDLSDFLRFCGFEALSRQIGNQQITDYLRDLTRTRRLSPATAKRRLACLRTFFRWLKRQSVIDRSPFDGLELSIGSPRRLPKVLSRMEIRRITAALGSRHAQGLFARSARTAQALPTPEARDGRQTTFLAIVLMTATGIRIGELVNIRLGDVDPSAGSIRVRGKGKRERTVYVANAALLRLLKSHLSGRQASTPVDDPLFLNTRGRPLTTQALRQRLRKAATAASIARRVTPHMLRHTAATLLIEEGVDIRFVQRLLGHASISTTEIYTHVSDVSLKDALSRADTIRRLKL